MDFSVPAISVTVEPVVTVPTASFKRKSRSVLPPLALPSTPEPTASSFFKPRIRAADLPDPVLATPPTTASRLRRQSRPTSDASTPDAAARQSHRVQTPLDDSDGKLRGAVDKLHISSFPEDDGDGVDDMDTPDAAMEYATRTLEELLSVSCSSIATSSVLLLLHE